MARSGTIHSRVVTQTADYRLLHGKLTIQQGHAESPVTTLGAYVLKKDWAELELLAHKSNGYPTVVLGSDDKKQVPLRRRVLQFFQVRRCPLHPVVKTASVCLLA